MSVGSASSVVPSRSTRSMQDDESLLDFDSEIFFVHYELRVYFDLFTSGYTREVIGIRSSKTCYGEPSVYLL